MYRSIASLIVLALVCTGITLSTAACSGCSAPASTVVTASGSGNCGSGSPAPKPTNKLISDCTETLEGPDNTPPNYLTTYVEFTCIDTVYNVTLSLVIWRSTTLGGPIATDANKVDGKTCDSLTGPCQIVIPCSEGTWLAGYSIGGTIDGTYYTDLGKGDTFTYSAGDCKL